LAGGIDARRVRLGLSRRALCKLASVHEDAIRSIANGHDPRAETLAALMETLRRVELGGAAVEQRPVGLAEPSLSSYRSKTAVRHGAEKIPEWSVSEHLPIGPAMEGGRLGRRGEADAFHQAALLFPASLVRRELQGDAEDFCWGEMAGSTMLPDLADGDRVLIDRRSTAPIQPAMFAVDEGMGLTARWLEYVSGSQPPLYRLRCSDPRFAASEVSANQITILGRIVWVGRRL
jgi:hypothetical protein